MGRTEHELPSRALHVGALIAVATLVIWCYAPALRAYFAVDDFGLLAISRLLGQPLLVFTHNHFAGGLYFRPLGFLFWWVTAALFGDSARAHYVLNLALHLACIAALYTLLQRLRRDCIINAIWAALYGVHPLAIGTALWLSDRFDLLATLCSLLALISASGYARRPNGVSLLLTLVAVALGLLSKEIAVVGAAVAMAVVFFAPRHAPLRLSQRLGAPIAIAALTLAWVIYRHAVLSPDGSWLPAHATQSGVLEHGVLMWMRVGAEYLACDPRLPSWGGCSLAFAAMLWLIALTRRFATWRSARVDFGVVTAISALILLPALIQATVANSHLHDLDTQTSWFALIISSRLYHLAFAGVICALMLLTSPSTYAQEHNAQERNAQDRDRRPSGAIFDRLSAVAALLVIAPAAVVAHRSAHDYAHYTRETQPTIAAAQAALVSWQPPAHDCQIYLLGAAATWGFTGFSDAMIKATSAQPQRLAHCLILTEQVPWTLFVSAGRIGPDDYRPLTPLLFDNGVTVPWLHLGDTDEIYFNQVRAGGLPPEQAAFFDYRDGRFIDITAEVRRGERRLDFFRSP